MYDIIIIGGGAAGLMAAISAQQYGAKKILLLERMATVGRKLRITGKGRCNVTNIAPIEDFPKYFPGNGRFLYSALRQFTNQDLIAFFEEHHVPLKTERGGRIFPVSDQAGDIIAALTQTLTTATTVLPNMRVRRLLIEEGRIAGVEIWSGKQYHATNVILATGGASYPATGSSGDGYDLAKAAGHSLLPLHPALVPLEVEELSVVKDLQGLSLRNVSAQIWLGGRKVAEEFGEMLFTHFGLTGPIILSLSAQLAKHWKENADVSDTFIKINLKPALDEEVLDKRLQRDFQKFTRKQLKNALSELLPSTMIPVVIDLAFLDPDKPVNQITKEERQRILEQLLGLTFTITRPRPLAEAIVTAGGIHVKEVNPKTMESRLVPGLYLAGEVLDIDAYTGGFNLQAAFSTGYVAGKSAAEKLQSE